MMATLPDSLRSLMPSPLATSSTCRRARMLEAHLSRPRQHAGGAMYNQHRGVQPLARRARGADNCAVCLDVDDVPPALGSGRHAHDRLSKAFEDRLEPSVQIVRGIWHRSSVLRVASLTIVRAQDGMRTVSSFRLMLLMQP